MYCNKCGKKNPEKSKFCQHCGINFIDSHSPSTPNQKKKITVQSIAGFIVFIIAWVVGQSLGQSLGITFILLIIFWGLGYWFANWFIKKHAKSKFFPIVAWLNLISWLSPILGFLTGGITYRLAKNRKETKYTILWMIVVALSLGNVLLYPYFIPSNTNRNTSTSSSSKNTPTPLDNQTLMRSNTESVVHILCDNDYGGSGTIWVKDGLIVTNNHVIAGSTSCHVTIPDVATGALTQIYEAKPIVAPTLSKQYDIALLSIYAAYRDSNGKVWGKYPISLHTFVQPKNCSSPQLGDTVRIYGYPVTSENYNLTITDGIISNFADDGTILTSAKVDSGNSGGLAMSQSGCMLGIPSAVLTGNYQNLGVIIPVNEILDFINKASSQTSNTNSQIPTDTPNYTSPQSYQQQTTPNDNQPAGGYQNYGWYMHNGQSMQYVDGNWYSEPQQAKPTSQPEVQPNSSWNWWGF